MNDKTLVIVDPYYRFLVRQLVNDGFKLIAVFSKTREQSGYYTYNSSDFSQIIPPEMSYDNLYKQLISQEVAAVVCGFDSGFDLALQLSSDLKIKHHNPLSLKGVLGNKFQTMQVIKKNGIPATKQIKVILENKELAVMQAVDEMSFPLIIKPTMSASSFGVYICHSQLELTQRANQLLNAICPSKKDPVNEVIIEEYLTGKEYAVCTVSNNGIHAISAIYGYEQYLIDGSNFVRSISLQCSKDEKMEELKQYALQVLKGLEYRQGQAAIEIMLTASGPRLVEFNPRVAGLNGALGVIENACTGMSQTALASRSYGSLTQFKQYVDRDYPCQKQGKIIFLRAMNDGVVTTLDNIHNLKKLNSFQMMHINLEVGDKFKRTCDVLSSPGYIVLAGCEEKLNTDIKVIEALEQTNWL